MACIRGRRYRHRRPDVGRRQSFFAARMAAAYRRRDPPPGFGSGLHSFSHRAGPSFADSLLGSGGRACNRRHRQPRVARARCLRGVTAQPAGPAACRSCAMGRERRRLCSCALGTRRWWARSPRRRIPGLPRSRVPSATAGPTGTRPGRPAGHLARTHARAPRPRCNTSA